MRYRLFGASGLRVSDLFLGAMTFGEQGGVGAPPAECARMLDAYADPGGNVIDTAINYRGGASEEILGDLLRGRRDRFVLATKYTVARDRDDPNAAGNHRKNLRLSLETSLRRLRTDYVDIYWVHMWDQHTPAEETMRALDDEVRAGKILYVGISDTPAWVISRANTLADWRGWTAFSGVQAPYSLLRRDIERELLPMAEAMKSPGRGADRRRFTPSSAPAASISSRTILPPRTWNSPRTCWHGSMPPPRSNSASPRTSSARPVPGSSAAALPGREDSSAR